MDTPQQTTLTDLRRMANTKQTGFGRGLRIFLVGGSLFLVGYAVLLILDGEPLRAIRYGGVGIFGIVLFGFVARDF